MINHIKDVNAIAITLVSKAAVSSIKVAQPVVVDVITNTISNSWVMATVPTIIITHFNIVEKAALIVTNSVIFKTTISSIKVTDMKVINCVTLTIIHQIRIGTTITLIIITNGIIVFSIAFAVANIS